MKQDGAFAFNTHKLSFFFLAYIEYVWHCGTYLAKTSFAQYFVEHQVVESEVHTSRRCNRGWARVAFDLSVCYKYTFATMK